MARVVVIVEGQTEESFVSSVLRPFFDPRSIFLYPRKIGKPGHRGGIGEYPRGRTDILATLKQDRGVYCTTMFDYYGMPDSWPGVTEARGRPVTEIAEVIERALLANVRDALGRNFNPARFSPYIQMHEYEGLLFSDPDTLADAVECPDLAATFRAIRGGFKTPEEIDDGPQTAPSKRIKQHCRLYQKVFHGTVAAERIGLSKMRAECPHFRQWLTWLGSLTEVQEQ
jgi:hypothetical protein